MTLIRTIVALGVLPLSLFGCGDDDAPPPPQKAAGAAPARAPAPAPVAAAAPVAGAGKPLQTYPKIDEQYRREFRERDFLPDPTGSENRDPFRSYVVAQGLSRRTTATDSVLDITDLCTAKNSKASAFSLTSLKLIGIVLRGTRSYALFRDSGSLGHIVHRNDCLGKEKAIVEAIGAGFVRLEVTPPAPPGGKKPDPEKRDIALYPEEYQLNDNEASDSE